MGTVHRFRRLWHGTPRKPPTPRFLRQRRSRLVGLSRWFGFLSLAMLMVAAGGTLVMRQQDAPKVRITYPRSVERPVINDRPRVSYGVRATVVDGDSLQVGGKRIRLDGIDAPELAQTCRNADGRAWPCGRAARARLAELTSGGDVSCTDKGRDRYGRTIATCSAGDFRDLGEALVREGYAINYDRYTSRYRAAQQRARRAHRGIWRGDFERPEDWRRQNPRRASTGWSGR